MLLLGVELELAELHLEVVVVALRPCALKMHIRSRIMIQATYSIQTGIHCPVVIDLCLRLETEHIAIHSILQLAALLVKSILLAEVMIGILQLAGPLNHVGMLLEVGDANAEVVELLAELSSELVNQSLGSSTDILLCHSLGNHLSHLVTSDVAIATIRPVAIAFYNPLISELSHSIIRPMISREIGERIGSSKSRAGCTDDESRRKSGHKSLLHKKLLLQ